MEDGATRESTNNYAAAVAVKLPPSSTSSSASSTARPHRCDICQRSFREVATLRKHEQLHRADRPYVCQTCGKSFLWSSNLKVHERVHTGERPYKCKICHRCFTQSNDLRRHERNVHMRGKLYGYKHGPMGAGRGAGATPTGGSHVNLAAYQAFAMQQRALLQQALTYESYLHTAAVTQAQMFPQPPNNPNMPANKDGPPVCMPPRAGNLGPLAARIEDPGRRDMQRSPVKLEQVTPPSTPNDGEVVLGDKRGLLSSNHGHAHEALQHSPVSPRFLPSSTCPAPMVPLPTPLRSPPMLMAVGHRPFPPTTNKNPSSPLLQHHHHHHNHPNNHNHHHHNHPHHPHHPHHHPHHQMSPTSGTPRGPLPSFNSFRHPPHSSTDYEPDLVQTPIPSSMTSPSLNRACDGDMENDEDEEASTAGSRDKDGMGMRERDKYPCDSVMDLSINKTPEARPSSASASDCGGDNNNGSGKRAGDRDGGSGSGNGGGGNNDDQSMPPPKTPSSESECEGKRDVTTTSSTPMADNGIHHCQHCNIFFYDYTMYHLHESLHMPFEDYPFRCPSCGKHCQDRIEFMFHTVWHVKYPHTIPNYEPFKDNFVS